MPTDQEGPSSGKQGEQLRRISFGLQLKDFSGLSSMRSWLVKAESFLKAQVVLPVRDIYELVDFQALSRTRAPSAFRWEVFNLKDPSGNEVHIEQAGGKLASPRQFPLPIQRPKTYRTRSAAMAMNWRRSIVNETGLAQMAPPVWKSHKGFPLRASRA